MLTILQLLGIGWCFEWSISKYFLLVLLPAIIFWIYGWYVGLSSLFSFLLWPRLHSLSIGLKNPEKSLPIAVLYTCCDDFQENSLISLMKLIYDDYHIYVLDNSTDPNQIQKTKNICSQFPKKVTYHYRKSRRGFKAGNINNGLRLISERYGLIAIFDADTQVEPRFLKEVVKWFDLHSRIAFVQGLNEAFSASRTNFSQNLGFTIRSFWRYGLIYKLWYGLPLNLGHSNIIKREALKDIGGFPEVPSEDIALTYEFRLRGWHGIYAPLGLAKEEYPPTLSAFRRRMYRWTKQDMHIAIKYNLRLIRAKTITLPEKIDAILKNLKYPLSGIILPYLFIIALASVFNPKLFPHVSSDKLPFFIFFILIPVHAPLLLYLFGFGKNFRCLLTAWLSLISLILTSFSVYFFAIISWFHNKQIAFIPTGSRSSDISLQISLTGSHSILKSKIGRSGIEILLSFLMIYLAALSDNYLLIVLAFSIFLGIILDNFEWQAFWNNIHFSLGICLVSGIFFTFFTTSLVPMLFTLSILAILYA